MKVQGFHCRYKDFNSNHCSYYFCFFLLQIIMQGNTFKVSYFDSLLHSRWDVNFSFVWTTQQEDQKSCALTSSKVVVRLSGFTGAKACTFGCGGGEKGGPPRAEHHHLFQLGVVIQGGVREAQRLWDLQGWQDHLGLGCSHPLLVLKLRWCWAAGSVLAE